MQKFKLCARAVPNVLNTLANATTFGAIRHGNGREIFSCTEFESNLELKVRVCPSCKKAYFLQGLHHVLV